MNLLIILACMTIIINAEESRFVNEVLLNLSRWADISTNSTCGEHGAEYYCIVSNTGKEQGHKCSFCNASIPSLAHNITNAIDGEDTWWKSENNPKEVVVNVNLKQKFFVTSVLIKMGPSTKPAIWSVERSINGQQYLPWIYLVSRPFDCSLFGLKSNMAIKRVDDVICKYSSITNIEYEEVVIDLIKGRLGSLAFNDNEELQNWTMATNVRLVFYKLHTLLAELIYNDQSVIRTQFYTIRDIVISGRCVCHGHDKGCEISNTTGEMECRCAYNTCGRHCEECCPGYHQYDWQPQFKIQPSDPVGCQACNCHGHSTNCYFNQTVADRRLSLNVNGHYRGGGICINCLHNTGGINCERCADGFYRNHNESPLDKKNCKVCNCNRFGSVNNECNHIGGICFCKPFINGRQCHSCINNYWGFPNCRPCSCSRIGSMGPVCHRLTGQCNCKKGMIGLRCEMCKDADNSIQTPNGCIACHNCSMVLLNTTQLWLHDIQSDAALFNLNRSAEFWIHVRLQWIDINQRKTLRQNYNQFKHQSNEIPLQLVHLKNSFAEVNDLFKTTNAFDVLTDVKSTLDECCLNRGIINNIGNSTDKIFKSIKMSTNSIDVSLWTLKNITNNLKKKCVNSCQKYIESATKQFVKEIGSIDMNEMRNLAKKELHLAKSLNDSAIVLDQSQRRLARLRIFLDKVNKNLMESYRYYILLLHTAITVKPLINDQLNSFVKDNLIHIEREIKKIKILSSLKNDVKELQTCLAKQWSEFLAIFNMINDKYAKLKRKVFGLGNHIKRWQSTKNQTIIVAEELDIEAKRISNEFGKVKSTVEPYSHVFNELDKIPNMISNSRTVAKKTRSTLSLIIALLEDIKEQLPSLVLKPEELLEIIPVNCRNKNGTIGDDINVEASGHRTDHDPDFTIVKSKLKDQFTAFINLLETEATNANLREIISEKSNDVEAMQSLLNAKNDAFKINRIKFDDLLSESAILNNQHRATLTSCTKRNRQTVGTINLIEQINRRIHNKVYDHGKLAENLLHDYSSPGYLKFKVDDSASSVNSVIKTIAQIKWCRLPKDFSSKITSIKNKIEAAMNSLANIQVPLSFQMFSYVLIQIPNHILPRSCVTTLEFWFFSSKSDAFLLSIGDISSLTTSLTAYLRSHFLVIVIRQRDLYKSLEINFPLNVNNWYCVELNWINDHVNVLIRTLSLRIPVAASVKLERSEVHDFEPIVYVGGLPEDKSLYADCSWHFSGCLGGLKINGEIINIFSWKSSVGSVSTCGTSPSDKTRNLTSLTFSGHGGLQIRPSRASVSTFPLVDFKMITVQRNGVLAYFTDTNQDELVIIKLVDGHVAVQFVKENSSQTLNLRSESKYNDGRIHHINIWPMGNKIVTGVQLTVDKLDRVSGLLYNPSSIKSVMNLGCVRDPSNVPAAILESDFIGCILDIKINNKSVIQINKLPFRFDFTMASCPSYFGTCMCLTNKSDGSIRIPSLGFKLATLSLIFSLSFVSQRKLNTTIIYYTPTPYSWLEVVLFKNNVVVKWQVGSNNGVKYVGENVLLRNVYKDSVWHSIILRNNNCSFINIDGQDTDLPIELFTDFRFTVQQSIYLGGTPVDRVESKSIPPSICYKDFIINDKLQDFSTYAIPNGLEICPKH